MGICSSFFSRKRRKSMQNTIDKQEKTGLETTSGHNFPLPKMGVEKIYAVTQPSAETNRTVW